MRREIFITEDGSSSLRLPEWNEQYHSKHGAIQEAEHVFLKSGLEHFLENYAVNNRLSILEIGFGTGLNALLTAIFAQNENLDIHYTGLEAYPIEKKEWENLNYPSQIRNDSTKLLFDKIHTSEWESFAKISDNFHLKKEKELFQDFAESDAFDLIYFDAFGAQVQPELWELSIFEKMFKSLHHTGLLVTYSAKGSVKRAMQAAGFQIEKIPGPPGKREMLRALKKS